METKDVRTTEKKKSSSVSTAITVGGFLCALLLSRVRIRGLHAPLPLGLLLGSQLAGFDPGAIVGGIILGTFVQSPPYWQGMSAALLYWAATRLVLLFRKRCSPGTRIIFYLLICVLTLPISWIVGTEELLYGVISIAVSVPVSLCFRRICLALRSMRRISLLTDAAQAAIGLGIGMLLLSVSDAAFLGWSLPVTLILLFTAIAVSVRGVFGAAIGILWTVMLTLYTGADPALIGCVALGALTAAAMREKGKLFIVGAFFFSGILFQTYRVQAPYSLSLPNLLSGMVLYLSVPGRWISAMRMHTDQKPNTELTVANAVRRTEQRVSREVERMGKLLGGFSGMFHTVPDEDDATARWTVQGALTICQGCELRRLCWKDADAMRDAVLSIAEDAGNGKRVAPIGPIDETCRHFGDFCASVLLAYRQAMNRNAVSQRAQKQAGFVERQFSGAGAALCTFARRMRSRTRETDRREDKIRNCLTEAGIAVESLDLFDSEGSDAVNVTVLRPVNRKHSEVRQLVEKACGYPLRCIRVAQSARRVSFTYERDAELHAVANVSRTVQGSAISGDATGECRISGGRVCFALSDGMGSGKDARSESEAAIRLLFRLYHAGVQKELIYENVNRMLLAQNEAEMYATLDAVSIDLNTGETELLKYGAPPSFLIRDGQVSAITGEALPCGIVVEAKPSVIRMRLKRNDRIVMCSDGVQDVLPDGTEQAIRDLDPGLLKNGEPLLKLARAYGGSDDMTVMVIDVA